MTQIKPERLKQLEDIEFKMQCLESGGVDNWSFYGESLKAYHKVKERELSYGNLLQDILTALCEGIHEPSERGAGYGFTEDSQDEAMKIMVVGLNGIIKTEKEEN